MRAAAVVAVALTSAGAAMPGLRTAAMPGGMAVMAATGEAPTVTVDTAADMAGMAATTAAGMAAYGWHGGWGCCGWGWGWGGLGLGLYFATLPLYYQTYYWGGVPYYYADNTYYIYDPNAKQYQTVAPPDGLQAQTEAAGGGAASGPSSGSELIAYPKNGQTADQQSKDKYECHKWAAGQTGYDPTTGGAAPAAKRPDYMRAQAACLEGRGYSVE